MTDGVINTLVGDSILSFFRALGDADVDSRTLPVMSFTLGENELEQLSDPSLGGHYVARADMATALTVLAGRLRDPRPAGEASWLPDSGNTGPVRLPIAFTADRPTRFHRDEQR